MDEERPKKDTFGSGADNFHYEDLSPALASAVRVLDAFTGGTDRSDIVEAPPEELESALRDVDTAFSDARLSDDFEACPHCYTDRDLAYLRTVPPLEMSPSDLFTISFCLTTTIGSARDIAYFVPAMIRTQLRRGTLEDAMVMRQLGRIAASDWTAQRRNALLRAYQAYFAWKPRNGIDLGDPQYRDWILQMLERPPHSEAVERPIPNWDS